MKMQDGHTNNSSVQASASQNIFSEFSREIAKWITKKLEISRNTVYRKSLEISRQWRTETTGNNLAVIELRNALSTFCAP